MAVLVADDLMVEVEGKGVVRGVSLRVGAGEVHALMGPNGSGKSSFSLAVAGHPGYRVVGGKLRLEEGGKGVNLLRLGADERARAGLFLSFQSPVAIPGVSVFGLLRAGRQARMAAGGGKDGKVESVTEFYERVRREAKALGMGEEFIKRSVNDGFSGGEKKKTEVLQMAVFSPKVAILDEPDTGLDVDALRVVARGVAKQAEKGTGILLITHYTRILEYLRPGAVHVLKEGRLIRSGGYEVAEEVERRGYEAIGEK